MPVVIPATLKARVGRSRFKVAQAKKIRPDLKNKQAKEGERLGSNGRAPA
jgi:hypothetical protein